jgi:hypothetical protein
MTKGGFFLRVKKGESLARPRTERFWGKVETCRDIVKYVVFFGIS